MANPKLTDQTEFVEFLRALRNELTAFDLELIVEEVPGDTNFLAWGQYCSSGKLLPTVVPVEGLLP